MSFKIKGEKRDVFGKNASRRLRRNGMIPVILYGEMAVNVPLTLNKKDIFQILRSESGENTVFEVTHPGLGAQDALAAGGRYDDLVEDFGGKPTGAFGFAIGMERLLMALTSENVSPPQYFTPHVYFILPRRDPKTIVKALEIRDALHEHKEDIYCEINLEGKSLKSQMRQADKRKAHFVVILGEEELARNEIVLRDMKTSEQKDVKIKDLTKVLLSHIKKGR